VATFRHWREGRDDPSQVAATYSGQFYDLCRSLAADAYAISSNPRRELLVDGAFRIRNRPPPLGAAAGPLSKLTHFWSALWMIGAALRFRADAVIIGDGTCYWFPLRLLPRLGIAVIPTLHCVFWGKKAQPQVGGLQRMILKLNQPLWTRSALRILSASMDISRQVEELAAQHSRPIIEFLPTYPRGTFPDAAPPPQPSPFRILFAGRIEANKGVYDLLELAKRLRASNQSPVVFELCGKGSALEDLQVQVRENTLGEHFRLHGHCDRQMMRRMFEECHVVIVPTTTQFVEGFNQVVVEGVLAGRPVITSEVCPALEYVRDAVVEVPPDDVDAYQRAIVTLRDNAALYEQKRQACGALQAQFYDRSRGWAAALAKALEPLLTSTRDIEPIDAR
jgi:glycogen(starch) synthase